jgi:hypothetical protein
VRDRVLRLRDREPREVEPRDDERRAVERPEDERRDEERREEELRDREDVFEELLEGTRAPELRASDKPIAIACFGFVTFFPDRPERSFLRFISCMARSTFRDDVRE